MNTRLWKQDILSENRILKEQKGYTFEMKSKEVIECGKFN